MSDENDSTKAKGPWNSTGYTAKHLQYNPRKVAIGGQMNTLLIKCLMTE